MKAEFKAATGMEWNPNVSVPQPAADAAAPAAGSASNADALDAQIKECGDKVRDLKLKKADKVKHTVGCSQTLLNVVVISLDRFFH